MSAIPTVPGGKNHTSAFAEAAGTETAHEACLDMSKALAAVGMRVLTDGEFLSQVCPVMLFHLRHHLSVAIEVSEIGFLYQEEVVSETNHPPWLFPNCL